MKRFFRATKASTWPLYGGQNAFLLNRDGDLTAGFRLRLPPLFSLGEADYQRLHQAWTSGVRLFDEGTLFHQQDWYIRESVPGDFEHQEDFLHHHQGRHFHGRPYMAHESYLFITRLSSPQKPRPGWQVGMLGSPLSRPGALSAPAFWAQCQQLVHWMEEQGLGKMEALPAEEIWSRPAKAGLLERYMGLAGANSPRISQDWQWQPEGRAGHRPVAWFRFPELSEWPAALTPCREYGPYSLPEHPFPLGYASVLGSLLPINHIYNQYLFLVSPRRLLQYYEGKSRRFRAFSSYSPLYGLAADACEDYLKDAQRNQHLPVKAHFHLLVWANPGEWEAALQQVHAAFHRLGITAKEETLSASRLFWAGLPGNGGSLLAEDTQDLTAEAALCLFNRESGGVEQSPAQGVRLADRLSGRPFCLDLSDTPMARGWIRNRNKFILGPSGSGKSFFTNHLLRAYYDQGAHIVLIDVGHSYQGLCRYLGGYYFTYDPARPMGFNPFYLGDQAFPDAEKKESLKNLLGCLWKKDLEELDRSEYVALSELVSGFYQSLAGTDTVPCFDRFYEYAEQGFLGPDSSTPVREKEFDLRNFLYVLRPYYQGGEWDYLLNATEGQQGFSHRFVVFELDRIKDHPVLFGLVTLVIMDLFLTRMRTRRGERKIMLIEEAWKAMARQGMAAYMLYLFKTVRKYYGEAVVVTQEIDDLIHSPILHQAIIQNSDCKIILDQSKYVNAFDAIARLLGLSPWDRTQILSLNRDLKPGHPYKEVFISLGSEWSRVYRVEVSLAEYYLYTTEEKEKLLVMEYERRYGSLRRGIDRLVADHRAGAIQPP